MQIKRRNTEDGLSGPCRVVELECSGDSRRRVLSSSHQLPDIGRILPEDSLFVFFDSLVFEGEEQGKKWKD